MVIICSVLESSTSLNYHPHPHPHSSPFSPYDSSVSLWRHSLPSIDAAFCNFESTHLKANQRTGREADVRLSHLRSAVTVPSHMYRRFWLVTVPLHVYGRFWPVTVPSHVYGRFYAISSKDVNVATFRKIFSSLPQALMISREQKTMETTMELLLHVFVSFWWYILAWYF